MEARSFSYDFYVWDKLFCPSKVLHVAYQLSMRAMLELHVSGTWLLGIKHYKIYTYLYLKDQKTGQVSLSGNSLYQERACTCISNSSYMYICSFFCRYFAVCFLNQLILTKQDSELATRLISIYFSFFGVSLIIELTFVIFDN